MPSNIVVPEVGESIVDARVAKWLREEGDTVSVGEPLVELETDKVDVEVAAPQGGVLKIGRRNGDDVKVGEVLGVIEDTTARAAGAGGESSGRQTGASGAAPAAEKPAAQVPASVQRSDALPPEADSRPAAERTRSTPAARKAAEDRDVDLSRLRGSGDAGRVMRRDVEQAAGGAAGQPEAPPDQGTIAGAAPQAAAEQPARPAPHEASKETTAAPEPAEAPSGAPQAPAVDQAKARPAPPVAEPRAASGDRSEERIRMSKRRATIARRLLEAQATAAMLTTFNEVDMSAVMALRERHKQAFKERHGIGLGIASFFVKASIGALRAFPRINAEIQGDEMVLKHYYDIGVAVGASEGLVVPVLRDADRMSFAEIERRIRDFARRAEDGSLSLADLKGGTFTITNGGVFGSLLSTPILNLPQVGILGLHAIQQRPVAANGQVVIRPMMYVALTYDHRIVDGAEAVQFLVRIKQLVEDPGGMLLD
jgi:2-oxoglutarate dehydrogenase E2 component (dihydrolipoamide succinyltransferase)